MRSQRRTRRQEVSLQEESEEESEEKSEEAGSSSSSRVNVVVRVRPPLQREREKQLLEYNTKCVSVEALGRSLTLFQPLSPSATNSAISPKQPLSPPPLIPRTFTFDYVADESVNQEEMFVSVGRPMAHACLQGYHCCLIAYGQTGAGKTYTMEGQVQLLSAHISKLEDPSYSNVTQECGLIPRILETIFLILDAEKEQSDTAVDFSVRCSSLQIYNEQVEDLLCPGSTNLSFARNFRRKNSSYTLPGLKTNLSAQAKIGVGDQTGSWSDHTSTNQVRRLEYIVAQSTKQALAGERKTAREMHSLMRKMDALKSMYMRLDRALEGLNASNLQKQRKDATFSASRKRAARDINAPDGEKMHSSDDSMVIESKAPEKTNGKVESNGPVKNLRTLQSQISQLKNLNQTLKLEIENLTKEKNSISVEVSDVTCERDESKQYLASLENENENLKEIIQKLKQEPDKDKKSLDGKERALRNFKNQKLPK